MKSNKCVVHDFSEKNVFVYMVERKSPFSSPCGGFFDTFLLAMCGANGHMGRHETVDSDAGGNCTPVDQLFYNGLDCFWSLTRAYSLIVAINEKGWLHTDGGQWAMTKSDYILDRQQKRL